MLLPYLPDEIETDCTEFGYRGVKVVWKPMDLLDKAKWADKLGSKGISAFAVESLVVAVRGQVLRVEGLEVEEKDGEGMKKRPFDVSKDFGRFPLELISPLYNVIDSRSSLTEETEKNSAGPSALPETSGSAG